VFVKKVRKVDRVIPVKSRQPPLQFADGVCAVKELGFIGQRAAVRVASTAFGDEIK
jgi:hypothetical protein